jgi:hypothetical protein
MNTSARTLTLGAAAVLAVAAPAAVAAPPTPHSLTIAAKPTKVVYGKGSTISGKLTGSGSAGQAVTLNQDPYPFGNFAKAGDTPAAADGSYSFAVFPTVNTRYQTSAKTKSPAKSPIVTVLVAPKVTLHVSDKTPSKGQKVRFKGRVAPAHAGEVVLLQRRKSSGGWKTVATKPLTDAGTAYSTYRFRRKIGRSGTYRVVKPADADHARGHSGKRRLKVG